ncbi:Gfo/Idh/MocA family protein [Bauldia litoralis]|uniref:Predicted dehydrogenase n=1 Tax=Bauldia litoralis TaxID=665467 RepID=A0A1G6CWS3_9HYPH|nr:Gfo/Idh/MocA family oxidoreductase [Bauldia litoralis]SDB37298.1 Predicted dehydrogenase [Bauldia litoralis]
MSYRGALIGCGFFAQNHMHAWADLPGARIVAVCDLDPAKAARFGETFGAQPFTDPAAMLAEIQPDFTDIATTVASHRALVELAASHSRAVICQKPYAETYADGAAMVAACQRASVPLLVHENFRWQLPFRRLKAELDSGIVGRPTFLRLAFRHAFDIYAGQPYLAEVQDLALSDVGLHLFDVARFLCGDVVRITCETRRLNPRVKGEDSFVALLRHADGATSSVECSFFSPVAPDPFPQTLAWLECTDGIMEVDTGYRLRIHRDGQVTESSVEPDVPAWGEKPWHGVQDSVRAFQAHVVAVLDGEAEPQPSGAHNLETLALALAAAKSARSGETQAIARPPSTSEGVSR